MSSPTFTKGYAAAYDALYADKDYAAECTFIDSVIRSSKLQSDQPLTVIDLACGTGIHLTHLLKLGYKTIGCDLSAEMLSLARIRLDVSIPLLNRSMIEEYHNTPGQIAICLFDAIGYLPDDEAVRQALKLAPVEVGGLLFTEYWHSPQVVESCDAVRVREFQYLDSTAIRISRTELNAPKTSASIKYDLFLPNQQASFDRYQELHVMRHFTTAKFDQLLHASGYKAVQNYAGYTDRAVDDQTWHVVSVAERISLL